MKKIFRNLIILIFIFTLILYLAKRPIEYKKTIFNALDTVSNITIIGDNNSRIHIDECTDLIYKYDELFSPSNKNSDIFKFNNSPSGVSLNKETFDLIYNSKEFYENTDKKFDITIEPVYSLWNNTIDNKILPDKDNIKNLKKLVDYSSLTFDTDNFTVQKADKNQQITLGSLAKGYICDKMSQYLHTTNIKGALIDLGGNIYAYGKNKNNSKWNVAIQAPDNQDEYVLTIKISNKHIVTSGNYQRYAIIDDVRYHHIIDAISGYPVNNELSSVTIIADNGYIADALSTCAFLSGLNNGINLINQYNTQAIFVTKDNKVYYSSSLDGIIKTNNKFTFIKF